MIRAGMSCVVLLLVAAPGAARPPRTATMEARRLVAQADSDFDRRRWDAAIAGYERAYELVPNALLVWNIARAHEESGDVDQAEKHFKRFLALDAPADQRASAEERLRAIEARRRPVEPPPPIAPVARPKPVHPDPIPAPSIIAAAPPSRGTTIAGWVSVSLGAAAAVTGGVLLGVARATYAGVGDPDASGVVFGTTQRHAGELDEDGDRQTTAGFAILGAGAVAAVAGLVLLLVGDADEAGTGVEPHVTATPSGALGGACWRF